MNLDDDDDIDAEPPGSSLAHHQVILFGLKVTQSAASSLSGAIARATWINLFIIYNVETLKSKQPSIHETFLMLSPSTTTTISL